MVGEANAWRGSSFPGSSLQEAATFLSPNLPAELCLSILPYLARTWQAGSLKSHRPCSLTASHVSAGRYQLYPWGRHHLHSPTGAGGGSQGTSRTQLHIQQPRQVPILMPSALGDHPPVSSAQDLCMWYGGSWEYLGSDETAVSNFKKNN